MSQFLAETLSWPKVAALAAQGAVALLPVGSTEAHGPHLPLNVDVVIAQEVCRRAGLRLSAQGRHSIVFPAIAYGLTDFAGPFAGTISLSAQTTAALLEGVLEGLVAHGFAQVVLVNHHLEPAHFKVVHAAAKAVRERRGAKVVVADHRRAPFGPLLGEEFMHGGSHAGHYETSLMLAAAPQLVDEAARRALPALEIDLPARIKAGARDFLEAGGPQAYFGDPAGASAEAGQALFEILADAVEAALQQA